MNHMNPDDMHGNFKESTDLPHLDDQADGLSSMVWSFLFSNSRGERSWVEPRTEVHGSAKCAKTKQHDMS